MDPDHVHPCGRPGPVELLLRRFWKLATQIWSSYAPNHPHQPEFLLQAGMVNFFTAPANGAKEDNKDSDTAGSDGNDGQVGKLARE